MQLNQWIDSVGGVTKASKLLNEGYSTVMSWYRFERSPRLSSAFNIISKTMGAVDFNGIYSSFPNSKAA